MSKELAELFERDMSASDETAERARRARRRGAAFDVDWEQALERYAAWANQEPEGLVRFTGSAGDARHRSTTYREDDHTRADDDDHTRADDDGQGSTAPRGFDP